MSPNCSFSPHVDAPGLGVVTYHSERRAFSFRTGETKQLTRYNKIDDSWHYDLASPHVLSATQWMSVGRAAFMPKRPVDTTVGHLIERMLEGQSTTTDFYRPFEPAWKFQIVEWLRTESFTEGMPTNSRSAFEKQMHEGATHWEECLFRAQDEVRPSTAHPPRVTLIEALTTRTGPNFHAAHTFFLPSRA